MEINCIRIATVVIMLVSNVLAFAQQKTEIKNCEVDGIYLTLEDFKSGKLTRPTDKLHKGDKIKLKQFFISSRIVSVEQGKETPFLKDSIFAIRLVNGKNVRFINRSTFLIADTSALYIYANKTSKTEYKMLGPHCRASEVQFTSYYFSNNNTYEVYPLTLENLRKYVLTDREKYLRICAKFTSDEMLSRINPETGRLELNETLLSGKVCHTNP